MDLSAQWQGVLPPELVRSETKPSLLPEELLDEEAFTGLGAYDHSEPDDFRGRGHSEEFPPPPHF